MSNVHGARQRGAAIVAGLAVVIVAAAITVLALRPHPMKAAHVAIARPATTDPTPAPESEPSSATPIATLDAPAVIAEWELQASQRPAIRLRTAYPVQGVEHPFVAYYRDPGGHTAAIWGGTGAALTRDFDSDAVDALLSGLGQFGGVATDHFGLAMSGPASTARCSQFTAQGQHGTSCAWVGDGAALMFVFGGLNAPGASDIVWLMIDKFLQL